MTRASSSTLGSRIREARTAAGLSQQALADAVGAHQPTVAAWESDRRSLSVESLAALSRSLGRTTDWLLGLA